VDGEYANQEMACPHCADVVRFQELSLDIVTGAAPPVMGAVPFAELSGPDQDPSTVNAVIAQLQRYCNPEESILKLAIQSRLMSVSIMPDAIAATTRRIIILSRGVFSTQMWDALWVDIYDVQISESITGATISVTRTNGAGAMLGKLPKTSARNFYRFCQSKEELMRSVRFAQRIQTAAAGAARVNVNIER
jgi:hypothetical protein